MGSFFLVPVSTISQCHTSQTWKWRNKIRREKLPYITGKCIPDKIQESTLLPLTIAFEIASSRDSEILRRIIDNRSYAFIPIF